jgi:hypothetical protein
MNAVSKYCWFRWLTAKPPARHQSPVKYWMRKVNYGYPSRFCDLLYSTCVPANNLKLCSLLIDLAIGKLRISNWIEMNCYQLHQYPVRLHPAYVQVHQSGFANQLY